MKVSKLVWMSFFCQVMIMLAFFATLIFPMATNHDAQLSWLILSLNPLINSFTMLVTNYQKTESTNRGLVNQKLCIWIPTGFGLTAMAIAILLLWILRRSLPLTPVWITTFGIFCTSVGLLAAAIAISKERKTHSPSLNDHSS